MTIATFSLTAGFVFVCVLLLSLNIKTTFHWTIKAAMTLLAAGFYIATLVTLPGFYGWPAPDALPQKFRLISHEIREPANEADDGVIFIWVESLVNNDKKPRAYQLPYHRELHNRLTAAQNRIKFGQTIAGTIAQDSSGDSAGLPRFEFMERPRPPAKKP